MGRIYEIKYEYEFENNCYKETFATGNENLYLSKLNECKNNISCKNIKTRIINIPTKNKNKINNYLM